MFSRILTGTRFLAPGCGSGARIRRCVRHRSACVSGFFGGFVDEILMRFTDMFLAFPAFVLAIAIASTLGKSLTNTMIALATVFWPWYARLVRAQVLTIRERDFIDAARSVGLRRIRA